MALTVLIDAQGKIVYYDFGGKMRTCARGGAIPSVQVWSFSDLARRVRPSRRRLMNRI
jgi:hypothetical protein